LLVQLKKHLVSSSKNKSG